ncbi:GGDEF domain-containing protein [Longispora sp. NPDC051575]|uniref:GGDEF domain-containing protein n=1 Tax=Longispora sp. NPDC051575 TaxID=3154943 RepID=UPI00341F9B99
MSHGNAEDPVAAEWVVFRDLTGAGRSAEVITLAERIVAESRDTRRVAQALIEKLVAYMNLGHTQGLGPLLDEIYATLRRAPDPRLVGEFHTMAGLIAYEQGSLGTAMTHLVHSERSLRRMTEVNLAAVDTWHDLSMAYSWLGFHVEAIAAMRQGARICAAAGLPMSFSANMSTQVQAAIFLDQRGDTDGSVRELRALVASGAQMGELVVMERVYLRYAVKRLAALGHLVDLEVTHDTDPDIDLILQHVNDLAEVCEAIAAGDPPRALRLLDSAPHAGDALGMVEPLRLRSIALTVAGDHEGALAAERAGVRMMTAEDRQLRELFTDSIGARLDQDKLRRVAAQYAGAASTDPLTGLPNRRRIAAFVAGLGRRGVSAMFGVLDLDGFKAVNDTHGHPSGDLVLQRIAGIFARAVRQGDLLARHGGDEFVVILPSTSPEEATEIGDRIRAAVDAEDWGALVPGTPVSVSIGWAVLGEDADAALRAADEALYRIKRARNGSRAA